MNLPPPILSNEPGSFPWRVLAQRHPALIEQVRAALPYGPEQQRRLDALSENIADGTIEPLPPNASGRTAWRVWAAPYLGRSWFDVPFLVAENLFYRHLLEAVGYFTPGPWLGVDPFGPTKAAELQTVDVALADDDQLALLASVWGNQADLGFRLTAELDAKAAGHSASDLATEAKLVADDSDQLWQLLNSASSPGVVLVADNAGRELVADLLLIDHLMAAGLQGSVALHVKPSPYFVSDAMTTDVVASLQAIETSGPAGEAAAHRLKDAARQGELVIRTHAFYATPLTYHRLPEALGAEYAAATVVLLKGDLNYRRLVGDCHWDPLTEFASAVDYFPGSVVALRTLKSDVILGLAAGTLAALDATCEAWRTSGSHALIQARVR